MSPLDLVDQVACLACLRLEEQQRQDLAKDLAIILDSMQLLQQLDLQMDPPAYQPKAPTNTFRPDEVKPSLLVADVLRNAPSHQDQFLTVPLIIEG